ncbi:MAG: nucleotidyltransferase family protein [Gemmatimonadetes bacterium]|nr:nucleotidyltransferase family protein [Gemmatimonadota bacterium]
MDPRERAVLFDVCRADGPPASPILTAEEWPRVVGAATRLGVAGQLRSAIARDPRDHGIPAEPLAELQRIYYAVSAKNALLLATLSEVLSALELRAIPVVVLKGAALLEPVYRDVGLRAMHDLDLMVPAGQVLEAAQVLEEIGFTPDEWYRPREWYLDNLHHLVPYRRGSVTVELHHRLLPLWIPLGVSSETLTARAHPELLAGRPVATLAPSDLLIHLTLHLALANRFAGGLSALRDIAEVTRRREAAVDWAAAVRDSAGVERAMYAGLRAAQVMVGADVSDVALAALRRTAGVGPLEDRLLLAAIRGLALRVTDDALLPNWVAIAWVRVLTDERSWPARVIEFTRSVMRTFAGRVPEP